MCDYESQKGREPGHWLTLLPALPWPHSQQAAAFPELELSLAPLALQSPVTAIYICYLLWKTTEGDNEALSG